jgi:hypothetical protein
MAALLVVALPAHRGRGLHGITRHGASPDTGSRSRDRGRALAGEREAEPAHEHCRGRSAVTTWGTNMVPYWLLDRPYWLGLVKIVLAAGKVTRAMPWTSPAA